MLRRISCALFLLASARLIPASSEAKDVAPAQPVIPDRTFNFQKDFGGVGDGRTPNTDIFRKAMIAIRQAGGGHLIIPPGTYFTGPVDLCGHLDLHLEAGATIQFSPEPGEYLVRRLYRRNDPRAPGFVKGNGENYRPLLLADHVTDLEISGEGTIDGSGSAWWPSALAYKRRANAAHNELGNTSPRPRLVWLEQCERVRIEGILLTHSPVFNLYPYRCDDVTCDRVRIVNPWNSPNTDGIDPSLCHRVLIAHCTIDTGDDCIAIKSGGIGEDGVGDILITDCHFIHGHGCSFGSETSGGDHDVTIRNCTFEHTDIGVRLKSDRKRGGWVRRVLYTDLTMKDVGQAIVISSYYPEHAMPRPGMPATPKPMSATTPRWEDITIRNVRVEGCRRNAGVIMGLPEAPVRNLTLENVHIRVAPIDQQADSAEMMAGFHHKPSEPTGLRIGYADGVKLIDVTVKGVSGPPLAVESTVRGLTRSK